MKNSDVEKHVRGDSLFLDDLPVPEGTIYASVFGSTLAHGKIKSLELHKALESEGVIDIITSDKIPGINQVGGIIKDESLLADDVVHFIGEPIALVLANNEFNARKARNFIKIEYDQLPATFDPQKAAEENHLIMPPKTFESGDIENAWSECAIIVEGIVESGGQEHLYLETQAAITIPNEGNTYKIISSTQSPTAVQRTAARVIGLPMHNIEVDVLRLGGAFGGKEDQATHWAVLSCLGAYKTRRPVKLVLNRIDDLRFTGKRHPYTSNFKIGLSEDSKILVLEVK